LRFAATRVARVAVAAAARGFCRRFGRGTAIDGAGAMSRPAVLPRAEGRRWIIASWF
jgi:hypothetical protein